MTPLMFMVFLLISLATGLPIFVAMLIPSAYYLIAEMNMPTFMPIQAFTGGMNKFSMLCLPFFILAASVMGKGEIGPRLLKFARNIVGHLYGGIALTAIVTCTIIGSISGASTAGILIIGALVFKEMTDHGYPKSFSAGIITTVSAVGMLIPPSMLFIVYSMNTNTSVMRLFLSGVGSGLLFAILFGVYAYFYARIHKIPRTEKITWRGFFISLKEAGWALGLPLVIIGGMYTGLCSPTEAAAISAAYAIFVEMFIYKDVTFKDLYAMSIECAQTCAAMTILLGAGQALSFTITIAKIPALMEVLLGSSSKFTILLIINVMFLIAGMFINASSAIIIIIPMVFQLARSVGIDPIMLGNIAVTNLAIGMSTAPFGLNLFVSCKVLKMSFVDIVKSVTPFLLLALIVLLIVTFVPAVSLWLPNLVVGQ